MGRRFRSRQWVHRPSEQRVHRHRRGRQHNERVQHTGSIAKRDDRFRRHGNYLAVFGRSFRVQLVCWDRRPAPSASPALQVEDGSLTIHDGSAVDAVDALVAANVNAVDPDGLLVPPGTISVTPGGSDVTAGISDTSMFSTNLGLTLGVAVSGPGQAPAQTGTLVVGGEGATGRTATVTTATITLNGTYATATINGGSHATVTQNGSWKMNGSLAIGDQYNAGFLNINSGGQVLTKGDASVGGIAAAGPQQPPNVNITSYASGWDIFGGLTVGPEQNSNVSIAIQNSSLLANGPASIGGGRGSKPAITVGADGRLTTSATENVATTLGSGQGSSASVVVNAGGNWSIGDDDIPNGTLQNLIIGSANDSSNKSYLGVYDTGTVDASAVTINSGAVKGTGTVSANVVNVGGSILPGDTLAGVGTGKLTIQGDLTDWASSTLEIDIGGSTRGGKRWLRLTRGHRISNARRDAKG